MVIHLVTALTSRVIGSRGCRGGAPRPAAPVSASADHDSACGLGRDRFRSPGRLGAGWCGFGCLGAGWCGFGCLGAGWCGFGWCGFGCLGAGWCGFGWCGFGCLGAGWCGFGWCGFGRVRCPGRGIGGSGRRGWGDVHALCRLRFGGDRPGNRFRPRRCSLLGVGVWGGVGVGAGLGIHGLFGVREARHPGVGLLGPGPHLCGPGPQLGQPRLSFLEPLPLVPHGQLPGDHEAEQSTDEESGQPALRRSEQSTHHGCQHDHDWVLQVSDRRFSLARPQPCRLGNAGCAGGLHQPAVDQQPLLMPHGRLPPDLEAERIGRDSRTSQRGW